MTDDGGPAFPMHGIDAPIAYGMSLRDWFAGQALVGLLIDEGIGDDGCTLDGISKDAYRYADAMLKAREKDI